jgi:hypothetical protein
LVVGRYGERQWWRSRWSRQTHRRSPRPARRAFEPVSGQGGKDVVWVPTPQVTVDKMLELTGVTASDYVIDLGSGNGITVITAAKKGATALGVEFNPEMVALSQRLAREAGVSHKATFVQGDLFEAELSKATVITLFLLPDINLKLRPKLLDLKPGTRVASNTFTMDDWEPDAREMLPNCTSWCTAMAWIVPAKVGGSWQLGQQVLTLSQQPSSSRARRIGAHQRRPPQGRRDHLQRRRHRTYTGRVSGTQ